MDLTSKSLSSSLAATTAPSTAICGNKTVERRTTAAEAATAMVVPLLEEGGYCYNKRATAKVLNGSRVGQVGQVESLTRVRNSDPS